MQRVKGRPLFNVEYGPLTLAYKTRPASMAAISFCKVSWSTSLKYRSFLRGARGHGATLLHSFAARLHHGPLYRLIPYRWKATVCSTSPGYDAQIYPSRGDPFSISTSTLHPHRQRMKDPFLNTCSPGILRYPIL